MRPNPSLERDLRRQGTWPARRWFLSSASRAKRLPGYGPSAQTLERTFVSEPTDHTGCELELMLAGTKPLAVFYAAAQELPWEELIPEEAFRQHVCEGRLLRFEYEIESVAPSGVPLVLKYVMYALPGEEWRAQLMAVLVRAVHAGGGWNESCERVEGTLLGYTEAEINSHCMRRFKRSAP